MHRSLTNSRQRVRAVAAAAALVLVASACGSDGDAGASAPATQPASTPPPSAAPTAPAATAAETTEAPETTESPETTETADTAAAVAPGDEGAVARQALLQPADIGDGWQDYGAENAFPMTAELAATVASCEPFVDVVFEGNGGVWANTGLGRNMDIAFTSVTTFATEAEAAAMVAATAQPEFRQCWADFNEVAVVALPFGVTAAEYEVVEPPAVELGGDSSSLHALEGTITLGSTSVPDSCVCAFVQQGRAVVAFHSAAPVFSAAARRDVIAVALSKVDETID